MASAVFPQNKIPIKLRLPMYLDEFIKDFAFSDIKGDLIQADEIFTDAEMKRISDIDDAEQQVILMFFFLSEKLENNIWKFVGILERYYDWLMNQLANSSHQFNEIEEDRYVDVYEKLVKVDPRHQDKNVHRLQYFTVVRTALKNLKPHHYVVLFGNLGCGKKWLAIDVCKDYGVLKSMNFSIHWLDMSECISHESDLEKLKQFARKFDIDTNQPEDVIVKEIKEAIKTTDPKSLLVLTDVQHYRIIKLFDFDTKVLITTRNKKVRNHFSDYSSTVVEIGDSFTDVEAKELLRKHDIKVQHDSCVNHIIDDAKRHPFILSTAAIRLEGKPWEVWREVDINTTNNMIFRKIEKSLNVFRDSEKEVFNHFVVFQHSVAIPVDVITKLCCKNHREMNDILEKFEKYSVIRLEYIHTTRVCYQKYLYFNYLRNNLPPGMIISELHRKLVNIYDLSETLNNPKDSTSFIENDSYFYSWIGYHLQKAGMETLLQRLYLDFRFLGQSIKVNGCQKTCGDFERYKEEIIGTDRAKEDLYYELLAFLPTVEMYLDEHSDANLLHYTLNSNIKIISEEARRQAKRIPSFVFFKSNGFQDGKQICRIRGVPKHIKLLNADKCLVSLENPETYLADLYLGYSSKPTTLVKRTSTNIEVVRSEIMPNDFLLTLDSQGILSTWDISHEKKRLVKRASSTRLVEHSGNIPEKNKTSFQDINDPNQKIVCYHVNHAGRLLTGNSEGIIEMSKWDGLTRKFNKIMVQKTPTKIMNMKYLHELGEHHCLLIDKEAGVHIVYFRDTSVDNCKIRFNSNSGKLIDVHSKPSNEGSHVFYLVFENFCYSLKFSPSIEDDSYKSTLTELPNVTTNTIKCSQLWTNQEGKHFLLVGTNKNLLVYDLEKAENVLWCYTEKPITCIDIFPLGDDNYKLIITAGLENKRFLQIYALTDDLKWAYENNASRHFPPNVRMKSGKNEFSVVYNGCDENCAMYAIDTENKLHRFCGDEEPSECNHATEKVTALAAGNTNCFFGCENGSIYNFRTKQKNRDLSASSSVSYMKVIDNLLIFSQSDNIFLSDIQGKGTFIIKCTILDALPVKSNVVALVTKTKICLWDVTYPSNPHRKELDVPDQVVHVDVRSNTLIFTTKTNPPNVSIYKIGDFSFHPVLIKMRLEVESEITKIALSHSAQVFAVGFNNGNIEIYETTPRMDLLFKLKSHRNSITDLKFSPWDNSYPTLPIVLASCSEKLCFWDISYAIKNRVQRQNLNSLSSRFYSPSRRDKSSENFKYPDPSTKPPESNPWNGISGISGKPELLACIKFNGNKAEKLCCNEAFTRFNTIDDSGGYYDFKVQKIASSES